MQRKRFVLPPLSGEELLGLQRLMRAPETPAPVSRRCLLVWLLAGGHNIRQAANVAGLHYTNAHLWVKRFRTEGLPRLLGLPRPGRPRIYEPQTESRVIEVARARPTDLGLGFATWSLGKLEEYFRSREGMHSLSRETIRRILHRRGFRFVPGKAWCEIPSPGGDTKQRR